MISRARLYAVALPLREPFAISGGTMTVRRSLIVELWDGEGHRGLGESAPFELPFYSSETFASARACLSDLLLPAVVGKPFTRLAEVHDLLGEIARGNRMAKAGLETAWWDMCAAREKTSLAALVDRRLEELGVARDWRMRRDRIDCGVALGIPPGQDGSVLRTWVKEALARGYWRIKIKVKPGWDTEPVRLVQEEMQRVGRQVPLWVDGNGSYRLDRDREALKALDGLGLLFLEQPLPEDAIWDSHELAQSLRTPICLDESLVSDDVARQVVAIGDLRIWNIKIQRLGGLEEACRVYARATRSGIALWGGTMPETGLGAQAMLALGGYAGFAYPSDIEPSERWYEPNTDLIELKMARDGTMAVPDRRQEVDLGSRAVLVAEIS